MSNSAQPAHESGTPTGTETVAHNARVWNYWLGGKDYYAVDKEVGDHVSGVYPAIAEVARTNREFLGRVVRYLTVEESVRQFLDIGTGLPTAENTHEVAQRHAPEARVVYVDNDPTVLAHAHALLTSTPQGATDYVDADAHDPDALLEAAARTLDFTRPVAVLLLGVLNFVADTDAARRIVERLMSAVPRGSYLALAHPTQELGTEGNAEALAFWNEHAEPPITARTRAELESFTTGLDLLSPGIVSCSSWRPEGQPGPEVEEFGLVARKG